MGTDLHELLRSLRVWDPELTELQLSPEQQAVTSLRRSQGLASESLRVGERETTMQTAGGQHVASDYPQSSAANGVLHTDR
jgi:pyridoxamine 5'-phosphate oxidase